MTPTFTVQLASQWATCFSFLQPFPLFLYDILATLLLPLPTPPSPSPSPHPTSTTSSQPSGPECRKTTNPNSGYKLQTCLWPGSARSPRAELLHRHQRPSVLFTEPQPQLHPCQPALWTTPGGTQVLLPLTQLLCVAAAATVPSKAPLAPSVLWISRDLFNSAAWFPRSYTAGSEPGQVLRSPIPQSACVTSRPWLVGHNGF